MSRDTMIIMEAIDAQDASDISQSVIEAVNEPWNAQDIGQRLKEAFAGCHTSREFDMVNQAVEAITGLPIQSLIEDEVMEEVL